MRYFILCLILQSSFAHSQMLHNIGFGVSSIDSFSQADADSGAAGTFTQIHFPITYKYYWSYFTDMILVPSISTDMLMPNKNEDDKTSQYYIALGLDSYSRASFANYYYGGGILLYTVEGDGGSEELNNGSSTSTFYYPSSKSESKLLFLNAGLDFPLSIVTDLTFNTELFITGLASDRRSYHLSFNFLYGF